MSEFVPLWWVFPAAIIVARCHVPVRVAIATSAFTLAIVATVGAAIHAMAAEPPWHGVGWSISSVLIGSTIGSRVSRYLPGKVMEKGLEVVFGVVGLLVVTLELVSG